MRAYELAFRMQTAVPKIVDLNQETKETRDAYGLGQAETEVFGRQMLTARRLVEKGVRFVQFTTEVTVARAAGTHIPVSKVALKTVPASRSTDWSITQRLEAARVAR